MRTRLLGDLRIVWESGGVAVFQDRADAVVGLFQRDTVIKVGLGIIGRELGAFLQGGNGLVVIAGLQAQVTVEGPRLGDVGGKGRGLFGGFDGEIVFAFAEVS